MPALAQKEIEQLVISIPDQAKALRIVDNESYLKGGELFHAIKDLRKEIKMTFDPIVTAAHKAHKEACAQKKKVEAPLLQAERILKPAMAAYESEQRRKEQEEQRRLEDAARKQAEDEALAAALHAEAQGEKEVAEAIVERPIEVAPIIPLPDTTKIEGVSYVERWKAEIVDLMALVKAIAAGTQPISLIEANLPALNQMARALKGAMIVPGVKAICEKTVSDRRR